MNKFILIIACLCMAIYLPDCKSKSTGSNNQYSNSLLSKLKISHNAEWDFGEVANGQVLEHNFILQNTGKKIIRITKAQADCGCTILDYPKEIDPGISFPLKVKVNTSKLSGDLIKTITLTTDNKEDASQTILLKLNVKPFIRATPNPINFGHIGAEGIVTNELIIQLHPEWTNTTSITEITSNKSYLTVDSFSQMDDTAVGNKNQLQNIEKQRVLIANAQEMQSIPLKKAETKLSTIESTQPKTYKAVLSLDTEKAYEEALQISKQINANQDEFQAPENHLIAIGLVIIKTDRENHPGTTIDFRARLFAE